MYCSEGFGFGSSFNILIEVSFVTRPHIQSRLGRLGTRLGLLGTRLGRMGRRLCRLGPGLDWTGLDWAR